MIVAPPRSKINDPPGRKTDDDTNTEISQSGIINKQFNHDGDKSRASDSGLKRSENGNFDGATCRDDEEPTRHASTDENRDVNIAIEEKTSPRAPKADDSSEKGFENSAIKKDSQNDVSTVRNELEKSSIKPNVQSTSLDAGPLVEASKRKGIRSFFSKRFFAKKGGRSTSDNAQASNNGVITCSVFKETKFSKVGIAFRKEDGDGRLIIEKITVGGLFSKTELKPGLEVVSINRKSTVGMTVKQAINIIRESDAGEVSVAARPAKGKNGAATNRILDIISEDSRSSDDEEQRQSKIKSVLSEITAVEVTTADYPSKTDQLQIYESVTDESNYVLKLTSFVAVNPSSSHISQRETEPLAETPSVASRLQWDVATQAESLPNVGSLMDHSKPSEIEFSVATGKSTTATMSTEHRTNNMLSRPSLSSMSPSDSMDSSLNLLNLISPSSITTGPVPEVGGEESPASSISPSKASESKLRKASDTNERKSVTSHKSRSSQRNNLPPLHNHPRRGSVTSGKRGKPQEHSAQACVNSAMNDKKSTSDSVSSKKSRRFERDHLPPSAKSKNTGEDGTSSRKQLAQNNENKVSNSAPTDLQPLMKGPGSVKSSKSKRSDNQESESNKSSSKSAKSGASDSTPHGLMPLVKDSDSGTSERSGTNCPKHHAMIRSLPSCQVSSIDTSLWAKSDFRFRATPNSGTRIYGIRLDETDEYLWKPSMRMTPESFLSQLVEPFTSVGTQKDGLLLEASKSGTEIPPVDQNSWAVLPINNGKEKRGKSLVIDFASRLFVGSLLIRIRGSKSEQSMSNRPLYTLNVVIRGRFRKSISLTKMVSGDRINYSPQSMLPSWAVESGKRVLKTFAPDISIPHNDDEPDSITPLGSSPRAIVVQDSVTDLMGDRREEPTKREETLIGKAFPLETSELRAIARKKAIDHLVACNAKHPVVDKTKTHTFEFIHRLSGPKHDTQSASSPGFFVNGDVDDNESCSPWHIVAAAGAQKLWSFELWNQSEFEELK